MVIYQLPPGPADEQLLAKLRDFRPHVVGLRIELGQFERVKTLCAAVCSACDAWVDHMLIQSSGNHRNRKTIKNTQNVVGSSSQRDVG